MGDPNLFAAMNGMVPAKKTSRPLKSSEKNRFELALSKSIEVYVDGILQDEDPDKNKLIPADVRRKKLELEVEKSLDLTEFGEHITNANNILRNEGEQYLSKEEYINLIDALDELGEQLENLDTDHLDDETLKNALQISGESRTLILKIGIAKFSDQLFADSVSIFTLLALLEAENPEYWYHLGLAAQEGEHFELAIRAYAATNELAPDFLGSRIFMTQCYLDSGQRENAVAELANIRNILKVSPDNEKWGKHVIDLESLLANTSSTISTS